MILYNLKKNGATQTREKVTFVLLRLAYFLINMLTTVISSIFMAEENSIVYNKLYVLHLFSCHETWRLVPWCSCGNRASVNAGVPMAYFSGVMRVTNSPKLSLLVRTQLQFWCQAFHTSNCFLLNPSISTLSSSVYPLQGQSHISSWLVWKHTLKSNNCY